MYTKIMFGKELKQKLLENWSAAAIGAWAFPTYWKHICEISDDNLYDVLMTLDTMDLDPQFELSYRQLNKIADDLIAGKEVDLNSAEYRQFDE